MACSRSTLVSELSAWDADGSASRSIIPVVTGASPWWPSPCSATVPHAGPQTGVGPIELGDLRGRAPRRVLPAGLGEERGAGVVEPVGEGEAGHPFGDQRPVPPLRPDRMVTVVGAWAGKAEHRRSRWGVARPSTAAT